jgi:hypothetical protein
MQVVTDDGLVRYDLLQGSLREEFRSVLKAIEVYDATSLRTQEDRMAFWMNAYNVQMLEHLISHPDVGNIIDDGMSETFFQEPYLTAGLSASLDAVENVILRGASSDESLEPYRVATLDPRLHVGINCGATSCPRLRSMAFTAENLNDELDRAMRDFVNSPDHFREDGSTMVLSSILDWFGPDFDSQGRPAGDYLLAFMDTGRPDYEALRQRLAGRSAAEIKAQPDVTFAYQWTVNRAAM